MELEWRIDKQSAESSRIIGRIFSLLRRVGRRKSNKSDKTKQSPLRISCQQQKKSIKSNSTKRRSFFFRFSPHTFFPARKQLSPLTMIEALRIFIFDSAMSVWVYKSLSCKGVGPKAV